MSDMGGMNGVWLDGAFVLQSTIEATIDRLQVALAAAQEALQLIACPMRPDGTWNRDREACRALAQAALDAARGK